MQLLIIASMYINLIIVCGKFTLGQNRRNNPCIKSSGSPEKGFKVKKRFFQNTLTINPSSFRIHISNHIKELFAVEFKLPSLIKERLEIEFNRKIETLDIDITNIQHSFQIGFSPREIVSVILPKAEKALGITTVYLDQEGKAPAAPTSLESAINDEIHQFVCLQFKLGYGTIKFQPTKNKLRAECSLVATGFDEITQKLIEFAQSLEIET